MLGILCQMGRNDQCRFVGCGLGRRLSQRRNGDFPGGIDFGDFRQHPNPVSNLQTYLTAGFHSSRFANRQVCVHAFAGGMPPGDQVVGTRHDVGKYRGGGGSPTCARPVKHEPTSKLGFQNYGVVRSADARQRMTLWHQGRFHTEGNLFLPVNGDPLGASQQFHRVPGLCSLLNILSANLGNALHGDILQVHPGMESQGG